MEAKKVLILGGGGMLGHKAYQIFSSKFNTYVTFRDFERYEATELYRHEDVLDHVDAFDLPSVKRAIDDIRPDAVLNCIGVIKQLDFAKDHKISIYINALFPHLVAEVCESVSAKLLHISTDCVFTGEKGDYSEDDLSDAHDLYGRSKYLGEIANADALTLRTSIIGHELFSNVSLVDWFLTQTGDSVHGFTNAVYTGFPTVTFALELARVIEQYHHLSGVYQVSSEKISKFQLLQMVRDQYDVEIEIEPDAQFRCHRSLDSTKFRTATGFNPPTWPEMIAEMHKDYLKTQYRK